MSTFRYRLGPALVATGLLVCASSVHAQAPSSDGMRQRYDKQSKTSSNLDEFIRKLDSDDPLERLDAVKSLGESKDNKAIPYLIQAVGDPDERVQVKAIEMLGEMRATDATPVLVQHLFIKSTRPEMKRRILASLGKIGDQSAAKPILEFLQRDLDPGTRGTAIYALGDLGASEALEPLKKIAQDDQDPTLRRLAREASNKIQYHQEVQLKEVKQPLDTFLPKEPPPPQK